MKNFIFVALTILFFSASSHQAVAQSSLRFIDNVEIMGEKVLSPLSTSAPDNIYISPEAVNIPSTEMCTSLQFKYAQLTEQEVEHISNKRLYLLIEDWYNTRYRLGGNSRKGIDCSSFAAMLADAMYHTCLSRTAREQFIETHRIVKNELKEGDLVFFNTRGGVSHVGMYLANGYFVHASSSNGVIISSMNEPYYLNRYVGAGRLATSMASAICD